MKKRTWRVIGLDVWGHCHDDCHNHGCECANNAEKEVECECSFFVNDRSSLKTINAIDTDSHILQRLIEVSILQAWKLEELEFDWSDEDFLCINVKATGRPLLQVEAA